MKGREHETVGKSEMELGSREALKLINDLKAL
jgi:hypothetical protein